MLLFKKMIYSSGAGGRRGGEGDVWDRGVREREVT